MVKIKKIIFLFLIFFSCNSVASEKIKIIRDAEIEFFLQEIILSISKNLKKESQNFYPRIILNDNYNAFVTGSNKIYVSSGLINKAKSINEIQGVIAHEIGHLILNHYNSRIINKDKSSKYSTIAAIAGIGLSMGGKLNSNAATGLIIGGQDLATKSYLQFTRMQEQAADKFALDIMKKANISLNGLKSLLSRFSEEELLNQSLQSDFYRSHPVSKLRLRQLNKYINLSSSSKSIKTRIFINDNNISLDYVSNKIKAYNQNPSEILNNERIKNQVLYLYNNVVGNLRTGNHDLAINNLNKLMVKFKNYPFIFELYGDIYFAKGAFNKAIENYTRAIKILNKNQIGSTDLINFSLVKTLLQTNEIDNYKQSIYILEELVKTNPRWIYLWRLLAKASGRIPQQGIYYVALAEKALIKKTFLKARQYVNLAFKFPDLSEEYRLRGQEILIRTKEKNEK